jgi:DNA-binding transcriptional regulator GbsR (MarR family)
MSNVESNELLQTELKVADTIGALMEFWGFKRSVGRLWTMLYLTAVPLGAAELGEQLSMSTGAVSMTLSELMKWGAIRKTWIPGERRDFYEVETGIWKLLTRVLRERELALVRETTDVLEAASAVFTRQLEKTADPRAQARIRFSLERVHRLHRLSQVGEGLLRAIISGEGLAPAFLQVVAASQRD